MFYLTIYMTAFDKGISKNLLRVALAACDARCTTVQLRFSATIAAARDGFSRCPESGHFTLRKKALPVYIALITPFSSARGDGCHSCALPRLTLLAFPYSLFRLASYMYSGIPGTTAAAPTDFDEAHNGDMA